ncbi:uncharacterized protein LOC127252692 [Andrographis paniculata]|uniref:uncharacterized protein LOC127252692 n=1 Tax=Andrographis paniculata TaxID=175694 RepID=UPI0021E91757|nr:uncharacterized protein LOC127252692 [Andrographis paniculata]
MENHQAIATESFSYSWLIGKKLPIPDTVIPDDVENEQTFNFDVGIAASLVPADELFSHGQLIPAYSDTSKPMFSASTIPTSPLTSQLLQRTSSLADNKNHIIKWRKSSKRILDKCFKFACKTMGFSRRTNRVNDLERKVFELQTWNDCPTASPRPSSAHSVVEWGDVMWVGGSTDICHRMKRVDSWRSSLHASPSISPRSPSDACCDAESSIREAILYCKRTIEK